MTRKGRMLLMLIVFLCTVRETRSQSNSKIIPLNAFGGDTAQYILTNFVNRKENYFNKNLGVLLTDLILPVKSYTPGYSAYNRFISPNIEIFFSSAAAHSRSSYPKQGAIYLYIIWQIPPASDTVMALYKKSRGEWLAAEDEYYKKFIICDIRLIRGSDLVSAASMPAFSEIYTLAQKNKAYYTYSTTYFINDSLQYTLWANAPDLLKSFTERYPERKTIKKNSGKLRPSSSIYKDYEYALALFRDDNFDPKDAFAKRLIGYIAQKPISDPSAQALAYVLHKYNTGVFLLEKKGQKGSRIVYNNAKAHL